MSLKNSDYDLRQLSENEHILLEIVLCTERKGSVWAFGENSEPERQHNLGFYGGGSNELLVILISIHSHQGIAYIIFQIVSLSFSKAK